MLFRPDPTSFLDAATRWAQQRVDVRAVVLVGSAARTERPADEWSDVDLILVVDDPTELLAHAAWLDGLGRVLATVVEPTAIGGATERRVLFDSGLDVDFSVMATATAELLPQFIDDPSVRALFGRGVRVLHDELGIGGALLTVAPPRLDRALGEAEYNRLSNAFWYDAVWTAKKLRRGEVWVAKASLDGQLRERLVDLLRWRTQLVHRDRETWHGLRFAEEWLEQTDLEVLRATATASEALDVALAIEAVADAFGGAEREAAAIAGYEPTVPIDELRALVTTIVRPLIS